MLHLDSLCAEPLAGGLSRDAGCSIAFFEYDQTTWGYCLFEKGSPRDRFWSIPEVVDVDAVECRGNVEILCAIFGVPSASVAPYLRHLGTDMDADRKVFADDEFALGDHWVRCDFMRRLGLAYPSPGRTEGGRHVQIVESASGTATSNMEVPPANKRASVAKRPWWRFG